MSANLFLDSIYFRAVAVLYFLHWSTSSRRQQRHVSNKSYTATIRLCCFPWQIVVESPDRCMGLVGNNKPKVLFEQADSDDEGECSEKLRCSRTGCVRASKSSSIFNFLGTHISMPIIIYYHCNVGLDLRPICNVGLEPRPNFFFTPVRFSLRHGRITMISFWRVRVP
jgi:hypothetical protein